MFLAMFRMLFAWLPFGALPVGIGKHVSSWRPSVVDKRHELAQVQL